MKRRRFVTAVSSIGAFGLAGCTGSEETPTNSPTETPTDTPTATVTPTEAGTPTDSPTPSDTPTATPEATPTATPGATVVTVAPGGDFRFEPREVTVSTGETVRWVWDAGGHNVKPDDVPSESEWTGSPGGRTETHGEGFEYEHAFEVAGTYGYVCVPHESFGMTGTVYVE